MEIDIKRKKAIALVGILALANSKKKVKAKKRKVWVKSWIKRRNEKGVFHNLVKELRLEDSQDYRGYLRMSHDTFTYILNAVKNRITKNDTLFREAIPPDERLAVTLRFLATGESMRSLRYQFRMGLSTIHRIIYETCEAIYEELATKHIHFPQSRDDWHKVAMDFEDKWQFNHCIGALDGKHINVTAPPNSGSYYYNYKGTFSVVLLALVVANAKGIFVEVGSNGRCHDSATFTNSKLYEFLTVNENQLPRSEPLPGRQKSVPYVIVGDEAFTLKTHVMRPFSKNELNFHRRVFNYRLSRARRISENYFGILASRFRILLGTIQAIPEHIEKIVLCICTLHNILRDQSNSENDGNDDDEDNEKKKEINNGTKLTPLDHQGSHASDAAKAIRNEFMEFFCNEGAFEKQWNRLYDY